MADIKVARLQKTNEKSKTRFYEVVISQKVKSGLLYVFTRSGVEGGKLRESSHKEFRYGNKATSCFDKMVSNKKSDGYDLLESKILITKLLSLKLLLFPFYSYLSKKQLEQKITISTQDLFYKPAPEGERILIEGDINNGFCAKNLKGDDFTLPKAPISSLKNALLNSEISNFHLDAYINKGIVYVLDIITMDHKPVQQTAVNRHEWLQSNISVYNAKSLKVIPLLTSREYSKYKFTKIKYPVVICHIYNGNATPKPTHNKDLNKGMWLTCIPTQVKFIVTSISNGMITLGHYENGKIIESQKLKYINYNYEPFDIVSVAINDDKECIKPIQIIGKLKDTEMHDCISPGLQLVNKCTTS